MERFDQDRSAWKSHVGGLCLRRGDEGFDDLMMIKHFRWLCSDDMKIVQLSPKPQMSERRSNTIVRSLSGLITTVVMILCTMRPNSSTGCTRIMGPINMPFGKLDYVRDPTKSPKFHRASPIRKGPRIGEVPM